MERVKQLRNHVGAESDSDEERSVISKTSSPAHVTELTIGGVSVRIEKPKQIELVPYLSDPFFTEPQEILRHFRWMMQKDALGQDMFLIGPPGPFKRNLVKKYCQLANREVEYIALSKDMTDGDLKQRREIQNGTAFYTDQASVRAAIHGRILILDGIEKAERNVLPIINNLLENREMALDDGRFLVHPKRFDSLTNTQSKAELDKWKLVRTSEKFVVIALGLPVPKYDGHPLDPPLRSRFQARNVNNPTFFTQISRLVKIAPNVPQKILERLVSVGMVLRSESATSAQSGTSSVIIPEFPGSLENVAKLMNLVNGVNPRSLLDSVYPHYLMGVLESEQKLIIESAYQRFEFMQLSPSSSTWWFDSFFRLGGILPSTVAKTAIVSLFPVKETLSLKPTEIVVKSGTLLSSDPEFYVQTDYHKSLLTSLVLAHAVSDICVIGPKGVGKSALLRALVKLLGYQTEYIPLFKDMSARDLLQRRSTNLKGDTVWENSALVKAAIEGSIAILDQIEVASEGVIASIQSLIGEREVSLPDGTLLVSSGKFSTLSSVLSSSELASRKVIKVHDSFRIVALARPTLQSVGGKNWLTPELMNLFMFIPMRALTYAEEREVIMSICPGVEDSVLTQLLGFANKLRTEHNESLKSLAEGLSTRQLLRCVRHLSLYPDDSLYDIIMKAQLAPFLPTFTREALERLLKDSKIMQSDNVMGSVDFGYKIEKQNGVDTLIIGNVSHPVSVNSNKLLIPDIVFYDNPKQTAILHEMLKDYILGEHLLLIGNQGVGKNKLVDKFLQLLQLPREYIQLHRDTTIHSLTSTPTIINGVLVYEDSPLVRACREGYILVVDEADKAPTHVTSVLKSLVEDGEMVLSDGRRLVYNAPKELENVIVVHNNFRMFVLANRPGFPFLGNDFYAEIGDVFAAHCIGNPDKHSELQLLKKYAPSVDDDILAKLVDAFNDLRVLVNEGLINYPYSTREIVSVVRHLESYPFEGLSRALSNVFDFDSYDSDVKELIIATLSKNGIHVGMQSDFKVELGNVSNLPGSVELERWNRSSGKGTGATECYSQSLQLQLLGGWPLKFHQPSAESDKSSMSKLSVLRRIDSRAVTFTEEVYAFKLPCQGEVLDICKSSTSHGDSFFALATNPITLYWIDGSHRQLQTLDLYEFFPLQNSVPQLQMIEVLAGVLCLHNPDENTILVLNLNEKRAYSLNIDFHQKQMSSKIVPHSQLSGILVIYQYGASQVIFLDFLKSIKMSVTLPVEVSSIHVVDAKMFSWVVQSYSLPTTNYLLFKSFEKWSLEVLKTKSTQDPVLLQDVSLSCFDHFDYPNSSRSVQLQYPLNSYGVFVQGLPEAILEKREPGSVFYHWPRPLSGLSKNQNVSNLSNGRLYLTKSKQIVTVIPSDEGRQEGVLEILDPHLNIIRSIKIPLSIPQLQQYAKKSQKVVSMIELANGNLLTVDLTGMARVWQTEGTDISIEMNEWKRLVGALEVSNLSILYSGEKENYPDAAEEIYSESKKIEDQLQGQKGDDSGGSGSGGQGVSGSGGSGGDGEGGSGGSGSGGEQSAEGRQSGTVDLSSFSLRTANDVPKEVTDAQKQMHEIAMKKRLEQLKMTEKDMQSFAFYRQHITREIRELRAIIEATEAKNKERVWLRNQSTGDVDDTKLVEGVTGERAIYKRRGEDTSVFQQKPKKLHISFDLSASMTRFNGLDSRLDRSLECALLIMEAFKSFEHKFRYKLSGHSGDGPNISFIEEHKYPKDEKDMFGVLGKMSTHAKFCLSGDNTVAAVDSVINDVVKDEADDYFALVLSDANITQYNIHPEVLAKALSQNDKVNAYIIFIGSIKDQADQLAKAMPNHAFVCLDTKDLPKILKTIFVNSMLK